MAAALAIRRYHARLPAQAEPVAARLALQALAADLADAVPRGLPPQSLLWMRRLALQVPALALRRPGAAAARQASVAQGRDQLDAVLARAARPALGPVPADAEAVLFADEAEMLACLALAASAGQLDRWWWRGLLGRRWPQWDVAWQDRPEAQAAAARLLARVGQPLQFDARPAVREVPEAERLTPVPARGAGRPTPLQTARDEPTVMPLAAPERPAAPVGRLQPSSAQGRALAAPVMPLQGVSVDEPGPMREPGRVTDRSADHPASSILPPAALAPALARRAAEPMAQPDERLAAASSETTAAASADRSLAAPPTTPSVALAPGQVMPARRPAPTVGPVSQPDATVRRDAPPHAASRADEPPRQGPLPAPVRLQPAEAAVQHAPPDEPLPTPASLWPWPEARLSHQAPLLFIVNALLEDGLYPDFTCPRDPGLPVPLWGLLAALAQAWRLPPDPLQALLAERAGEVPTGDLPAAPGVAAGPWAQWLPAYARSLRRRLCRRLGWTARRWAGGLQQAQPARLWLSESSWVIEFDLAHHDVAWRLAGLDRDPGWLPSVDCRLQFRFL